jgi:hypothetical protein
MAYRSSTGFSATTTSPSWTKPAGATSGDVVIIWGSSDAQSTSFTWPTGFTQGETPLSISAEGATLGWAYRMLDGTEGASFSGTTSASIIGGAICISGRHATAFLHRQTSAEFDTGVISPWTATTGAYSAGVTTSECDLIMLGLSDNTVGGDVNHSITGTGSAGWVIPQDLTNSFYNNFGAYKEAVAVGDDGVYTFEGSLAGGPSAGRAIVVIALAVGDTSTLTQDRIRWYDNNGVEAAATGAVNENTDLIADGSAAYILRNLVDANGDPSSYDYQLEHRIEGVGSWLKVLASLPSTTMPTVVSVGTVANGTGAVSPGLPASLQDNDILVMFIETNDQTITVAGWTQAGSSPQSQATDVTRLTVFWHRYNSASPPATTTSDSGDHQIARIIAIRGCITSGDPFNITGGSSDATSSTSATIPGVTTTVDNCLVLAACGVTRDATSTTNFSAWANASLASVAEQMDNTTTSGLGGGFGVASGEKATAGATGNTTATLAVAGRKTYWTGALTPEPAPTHYALLDLSTHIPAGGTTATTARLTPPTGKTTSDFDAGYITDDTNPGAAVDIGSNRYAEFAHCVKPILANVTTGDRIEFRITKAGIALDTYGVYGVWEIGTASANQNYNANSAVLKALGGSVSWTRGSVNYSLSSAQLKVIADSITWTKGSLDLSLTSAVAKFINGSLSWTTGATPLNLNTAIAFLRSSAITWAAGAITLSLTPSAVLKALATSISFSTGGQNLSLTSAFVNIIASSLSWIKGGVTYAATSAIARFQAGAASWTIGAVSYSPSSAFGRLLAGGINFTTSGQTLDFAAAFASFLSGSITFSNSLQLFSTTTAVARFVAGQLSWLGGDLILGSSFWRTFRSRIRRLK